MIEPKISIIMGAYNCENIVSKSIESVINQSYDNWELIICDDASTDRTYDVINDYSNDKFLLEDLMDKEDLKKYIPEKNTINYKRIYDDFDKMEFSETTLSNFKKLFDLLIKK